MTLSFTFRRLKYRHAPHFRLIRRFPVPRAAGELQVFYFGGSAPPGERAENGFSAARSTLIRKPGLIEELFCGNESEFLDEP